MYSSSCDLVARTSNHSYLVPVCWSAITDSNIGTAVDLWCSDESSATATYGTPPRCTRQLYDSPIYPSPNNAIEKHRIMKMCKSTRDSLTPSHSLSRPRFPTQGDITGCNTSAVTDMSWLFYESNRTCNPDISSWDTSSVTTMEGLFFLEGEKSSLFNQIIKNLYDFQFKSYRFFLISFKLIKFDFIIDSITAENIKVEIML